MIKKTAILFFARSPESEAQAKAWTKSKRENLRLARSLHQQVSSVLAQSHLPVFTSDQVIQKGRNFNEKITTALSDFFEAGYENAIVVGSDCADLTIGDIKKAETNFHNNTYTYGASFDGGVYLFTLTKGDFNKDELLSLPWCTNGLSMALVESIYNQSSCAVANLQQKADFDRDLEQLRPVLRFILLPFRQLLLKILNFCKAIVFKKKINSIFSFTLPLNKGSPCLY